MKQILFKIIYIIAVITILIYFIFDYKEITNFGTLLFANIFSTGRIMFIALLSNAFALSIGFILGSFYLLNISKPFEIFLGELFLIPQIIYYFVIFKIYNNLSIPKIIFVFAIINSYYFFKITIEKIKEMEQKEFIYSLYSIGLSKFKISTKHIFPNLSGYLFIQFKSSVIFTIITEFVLTVSGLVNIYKSELSIGNIVNKYFKINILYFVVSITIFTLFILGLVYVRKNKISK